MKSTTNNNKIFYYTSKYEVHWWCNKLIAPQAAGIYIEHILFLFVVVLTTTTTKGTKHLSLSVYIINLEKSPKKTRGTHH